MHCEMSHIVFDAQPNRVLAAHGVDLTRCPRQVLKDVTAPLKKSSRVEDSEEEKEDGEVTSGDSAESGQIARLIFDCV